MPKPPLAGVVLARVSVTRVMTDTDTVDVLEAVDGNGDPLELSEALGMLCMAEHTIAHDRLDD